MSAVTIRPYRPSSGTEGMDFEAAFCDRCKFAPNYDTMVDCDILSRTFWNNVGDPDYPWQWVSEGLFFPQCAAFVPKDNSRSGRGER